MDYARAVAALYQAPHGEFVGERKRLAAELKTAGDRDGAKALAKLGRPPVSAWAVNQLYWHARDAFDRLMATAAQLRDGDLSASPTHRDALARLRQRAATILSQGGHTATEATLRRTAQTLAAIAAIGSFAPDPPGALAGDRDPPGFEAAGIAPLASPPPMLSIAPPPTVDAAAPPDADEDADEDEDDDDDDTVDPDIGADERAAATELLRAAAAARPASHLKSVPVSVRAADRAVRAPDDPGRLADELRRPRHLSSVPPSATPVAADDDEATARATDERKRIARERERLITELDEARRAVDRAAATVAALERELAKLDV